MIEVFKIVKQKYEATIVTEISVNSSSVTRGNNYKLLNQAFTTTYGIYTEDTPPACMRDPASNRGPASISTSESDPRPVCGARRLSGARLLSEVLRYAHSVWCPYKKCDITDIEKVKKRATKLIFSLKNCSYKERLKILNLPTLKYRRLRGDMIDV